MPLSLFQSAYISVRTAVGEHDWSYLIDLQRANLIGREMRRLREVGQSSAQSVEEVEQADESAACLPASPASLSRATTRRLHPARSSRRSQCPA
jgi:hypothetical protein